MSLKESSILDFNENSFKSPVTVIKHIPQTPIKKMKTLKLDYSVKTHNIILVEQMNNLQTEANLNLSTLISIPITAGCNLLSPLSYLLE